MSVHHEMEKEVNFLYITFVAYTKYNKIKKMYLTNIYQDYEPLKFY